MIGGLKAAVVGLLRTLERVGSCHVDIGWLARMLGRIGAAKTGAVFAIRPLERIGSLRARKS